MVAFLALFAVSAFPQDEVTSPREDILAALDLPAAAQSLRDKGVDKGQVREAMQAAKGKKLKAKEAKGLMKDAGDAVDEHGPIDNFGAFVKSKLDAGLRGRDLAAAIRAEHVARGKGKGHGKKDAAGKGNAKEKETGKDKEKEGAGSEKGGGKPEDKGGGKPEDKGGGKPEDKGGGKPEGEKEQGGAKGGGQGTGKK
jgi:hypothetical protein